MTASTLCERQWSGASESVPRQSAGHSSCMQRSARTVRRCLRFSSLTDSANFQLCHRDEYSQRTLCRKPSRIHRCSAWLWFQQFSILLGRNCAEHHRDSTVGGHERRCAHAATNSSSFQEVLQTSSSTKSLFASGTVFLLLFFFRSIFFTPSMN